MRTAPRALSAVAKSHAIVFAVTLRRARADAHSIPALPYFWDELGQFVPAALDILRDNAWVPHSTVPNVHPPAVMAYLALAWKLFGYSELVTRVAMLLMGLSACMPRSCSPSTSAGGYRSPGVHRVGLLAVTPLFYMQAMMAQLDMPAMTFTVLALLLFVQGTLGWCVVACTVLVLVKETGAVAPAVFAAWLIFVERRWKPALWFAVPFVALGVWLFVLWRATGHILGDPGFAHYNVAYRFIRCAPRPLCCAACTSCLSPISAGSARSRSFTAAKNALL
jgi:4-amino-4-deoxy-L-arabinose transferase-like glycosyltransferase